MYFQRKRNKQQQSHVLTIIQFQIHPIIVPIFFFLSKWTCVCVMIIYIASFWVFLQWNVVIVLPCKMERTTSCICMRYARLSYINNLAFCYQRINMIETPRILYRRSKEGYLRTPWRPKVPGKNCHIMPKKGKNLTEKSNILHESQLFFGLNLSASIRLIRAIRLSSVYGSLPLNFRI